MPDRSRLSHVALRGCLITAILLPAIALNAADEPRQPAVVAQPEKQPEATQPSPPDDKKLTPEEYRNPCGPTDRPDVADLCEQRRVAEATEQSVKWAERQFWASVGGIFGLLVTIYFSARATRAAITAAKAAEANVTVAAKTAKRQLRAYVSLFGATVDWLQHNRTICIKIHVRNTGQTPAYGVQHVNDITIGDPDSPGAPDQTLVLREAEGAVSSIDLGAGTPLVYPHFSPVLDIILFDDLMKRRKPLYIQGEIRYHDIFRNTLRHTRYRMMLSKNTNDLVTCPEGNEST